ncbi:carboxypeptidase-like regulatory domain-containing protein [Marinifilum caeruleilacunae]|uniref:Carboxypeptidase-like regulatory domain-containing protein n=1 Tax=Marinifilum caeruleilacunae TaxID=2499076 RepID=A0ABX1WVR3_9BACT|nr:carboxypeptidase-like regulatory domain-containing protein [Marinifilum caeruleilacunae]NOU60210.1 hypothetical protein [Marinifilum caeruleilacunae]
MRRYVIGCIALFCFVLASETLSAQKLRTDSLFFTGAVMDQEELAPLPYAHYKVNNKKAGTSNAFGRFSFWVNAGDTIQYSYVGYQNVQVVVSDSLTQDSYLFGVFMAKDTVALQEVLILPRFGDFKQAFISAKVNTPEYVRAKNNVNSATYEALTKRPEKMDAKANTDLLIQQHVIENEHKAMVPQEMVAGVSTLRTLPEVKRIQRKRKMKIPDNLVTDKEITTLKQMYRYGVKNKK